MKRSPKDPDYWRRINPQLNITEAGGAFAEQQMISRDIMGEGWRENLIEEGYLQYDSAMPSGRVSRLREGVENLVQESWPAIYSLVYDDFWNYFADLNPLISQILGEEYRMLPDLWVWHIDPAKGASGWPPHRDRYINTLRDDGMPQCITIWAPLSDATPLNGCMSIVPAHLDSDYRNFSKDLVAKPELQTIRALPAPAGSILLWNHRLLHWGGASSKRAAEPRISLAFEFQRGDIDTLKKPLLDPDQLPGFDLRLQFIVKLQAQYLKFTG